MFKALADGDQKGKTVFAVSHGAFMSALYCLITQQPVNESFIPHNNSLMIIDFEHQTLKHSNGTVQEIITPKLRAMNF